MSAGCFKIVARDAMTFLVLFVMVLAGCASEPLDVNQPQPWDLKLYCATANRKYTYFEINPAGMLSYGGGRSANLRNAEPVVQLTDDQRQQIWRIIVEENLLDAQQPAPWTSDAWESVRKQQYDLSLRVGHRLQSLRCIDDQPGEPEIGRAHV